MIIGQFGVYKRDLHEVLCPEEGYLTHYIKIHECKLRRVGELLYKNKLSYILIEVRRYGR